MKNTIHIVHLHIQYHSYYTGVDRYLDMFKKGIQLKEECENIKMHSIYLTTDIQVIFPRVKRNKNGEYHFILPLPQNQKLLFKDDFWKDKYIKIISEIVELQLVNITNPIFQCHNLFLFNLALELKRRFGGKILTHLHCLPWKFFYNSNLTLFNKLHVLYDNKEFISFKNEEKSNIKYYLSDYIICLSSIAKEYLIKIHNIDSSKIKIIQNGLESVDFDENSRRKTDKAPIALYVGKVSKDKGIFDLLEALYIIAKKSITIKLIIAGNYTDKFKKEMKLRYKTLDIDYKGQLSYNKLKRLYLTSTFGVIPSLYEQCSYVAIEMSMFGLPMIVSNIDALAEMFDHEETALMTPLSFDSDFGVKANMEIFIDNIIRLIKDDNLKNYLSKRGRDKYHEYFTLNLMVNNTIKLYKELI